MGRKRKPRPICEICKVQFQPKSRIALSKARFCSNKCRGVWRSQDPDILKHLKEIAPLGYDGLTEGGAKRKSESMKGYKNPAWKGGVTYKRSKGNYKGAKCVKCPEEFIDMKMSNGYVSEHRLIMAKHLNRSLTKTEVVHHIDHDPHNNSIENLMLFATNREHKIYEGQELK